MLALFCTMPEGVVGIQGQRVYEYLLKPTETRVGTAWFSHDAAAFLSASLEEPFIIAVTERRPLPFAHSYHLDALISLTMPPPQPLHGGAACPVDINGPLPSTHLDTQVVARKMIFGEKDLGRGILWRSGSGVQSHIEGTSSEIKAVRDQSSVRRDRRRPYERFCCSEARHALSIKQGLRASG